MRKYYLLLILCLALVGCKSKTYTVTFMDEDIKLSTVEVEKGANISKLEKPSKEGYIFLNWLKDGLEYNEKTPVTEDIILEAAWTEVPSPVKTYTVSFNYGTEIRQMSVKENDLVPKPKQDPHKEKHKFLGWYDGDTLYDFNRPVTKDFALVAKFERNRIIIDYDLNGGSGVIQTEIEKGTIPNKPKEPVKFGYTFKNWTIDNELYNFETPLDKDTTIKANYEANIYVEVSFNTNGGNNIQSQMIISGETIKDFPVPEKNGYKFLYWTYNDEKFDSNMIITANIELVAKYGKTSD